MKTEIYYLIIFLVIAAIALVYNLYQIWFTPEKYIKNLVMSVKDWWPFADYHRKSFASKTFLWFYRIFYALWLLIVIVVLCLTILGVTGLFP